MSSSVTSEAKSRQTQGHLVFMADVGLNLLGREQLETAQGCVRQWIEMTHLRELARKIERISNYACDVLMHSQER
jgi:hypothetical protein